MLKPCRPAPFRRTIAGKGGKKTTLKFERGVPVDLTKHEIEALRSDIGSALVPVELDAKGRPRIITDEVDPPEEQPPARESKKNEPPTAD